MKGIFKYLKSGRAVATVALSLLFVVGAVNASWDYIGRTPDDGGVNVGVGFSWKNYYKQELTGGNTYTYIYGYNSDNYNTIFDGNKNLSNDTSFRWTNFNSSLNDEFKKVSMELHKTRNNEFFTFDEIRLHHFVDSGGAARLPQGVEISYLDENGDWAVFVSCTLEGDGYWSDYRTYSSEGDNAPHYMAENGSIASVEQSWRYPGWWNGNYRMQLRSESGHGVWKEDYSTADFSDPYANSGGTAPFTVFKIGKTIKTESVKITLIPADSSNQYNCTGLAELEFFVNGVKYPEGSAP